jgi:hypothetical protein
LRSIASFGPVLSIHHVDDIDAAIAVRPQAAPFYN